jgi:hypothetical protein
MLPSAGRRIRIVAFTIALSLCAGGPAGAQVDMTGSWLVRVQEPNYFIDDYHTAVFSQSGTTLSVDFGYLPPGSVPMPQVFAGSIDAAGTFHLERTRTCYLDGMPFPETATVDGTVSPDGNAFSAIQHDILRPGYPCHLYTPILTGQRIPQNGCGDGDTDAGEDCDVGPAGGPCCTPECRFRPAGTHCGTNYLICTEMYCTASGACESITPPDADGDGTPDRCDPCTNGGPISRARLKIRGDSFTLSGRIALAPATLAALDLRARGVWVRVIDAVGHGIVQFDLSGTDIAPHVADDWQVAANGNKWIRRFTGRPRQQLKVSRVPATSMVTFAVRGKTNVLPAPPPPFPLRLQLVFDPPAATTGQCGEATFLSGPPAECALGSHDVVFCAQR